MLWNTELYHVIEHEIKLGYLTYCVIVTKARVFVSIGSGNSLGRAGTKLLPEPMITYCLRAVFYFGTLEVRKRCTFHRGCFHPVTEWNSCDNFAFNMLEFEQSDRPFAISWMKFCETVFRRVQLTKHSILVQVIGITSASVGQDHALWRH